LSLLSVLLTAPNSSTFPFDSSPFGEKVTQLTGSWWPLSVCCNVLLACQSLIVLLSEADANNLPSDEKAAELTGHKPQSKVCITLSSMIWFPLVAFVRYLEWCRETLTLNM
jgi:hypothetical protein